MKEIIINNLYFTELKPTTKKAQELVNNYNNSRTGSLFYVYGRPSYYKEKAYNNIKEECRQLNGWGIRITTYSKYYFTMAYKMNYNNCEYLVYHTPNYRYLIKLSETTTRNPETITVEEVKARYDKLTPNIKEALARSCPTLNSMEQVEKVLKISEAFSLMENLVNKK